MTDPHSTLLHRWFQEVWNKGDEQAVDELMADDAIAHGITHAATGRGPEGFNRQFRSDFSDIHIEIDKIVTDDNMEVAHCFVTATHTKSGKAVSCSGISMARTSEGKIAEAWNYYDFLGLYKQLGYELVPQTN